MKASTPKIVQPTPAPELKVGEVREKAPEDDDLIRRTSRNLLRRKITPDTTPSTNATGVSL